MGMNFEEVCDVKAGERYCESSQYGTVWFTVLNDPEVYDDGEHTKVEFMGEADDGGYMRFLITKGLEHYGPNICHEQVYMSIDELRNMGDEDDIESD